jgi:uncharacterized delta-60 repeat protein
VQADGKILVGGDFSTLGGQSRSRIGRLNANGAIDTTFNPGANGSVRALALQADGRILVGGGFTTLGGQPLGHIARINANGTPDLSFTPGANNTVHTLAIQADGKILVGGDFTMLGGQPRNRIARLHEDGTLDSNFNPGADNTIFALAVQADGKILVGGAFTSLGGETRLRIGRLNPDGSLDPSFNPGANFTVRALAAQADGKILAAGNFTTLAGQTRSRIGRLNANGSLDSTFNPGADGFVIALALQADGKILAGGEFNTLAGQTRDYIGRLSNDMAAVQSLEILPGGITVKWLRSGASPELEHVIFESSANDVSYSLLGPGMRTNGGWMLTGLALPLQQNLFIRARGYYGSGESTGSSSVAGSVRIAHLNRDETVSILTTGPNPSIRGQNVSFRATVRGVTPDSGVPTGTATLTVNAIPLETRPLDASGVVTYNTSTLTVGDHSISVQYSGDASFNGSQTDPITQTVKPAGTLTTLFNTPNFSLFGQPVTLRATVIVLSPGAGIADGNVTFMLNGAPLETRPVDFGLAFYTLSDLPVGEHDITVHYEGSDSFNSSTSEPIKQTVARADTTTALVIAPNPAVFGQSIGLAAFVNVSAPGAGTPSGIVTFVMNGAPLEARPLSAGVATYSVPDLAAGEYLFTVEYEGDESFNSSSGQPVAQAVERASTTILLVVAPNPSVVGESITLTATIGVVAPGNGTPTGAVTFTADGAPLDSFTLDASGVVTYTTAALPVGEYLLAIQYEGDLSFQGSTAPTIMQTVQPLWEIYLPMLEGLSEDIEGERGVFP